ncbi:hypothetical protein GCM10028806_31090 [Spirosoma terrae]
MAAYAQTKPVTTKEASSTVVGSGRIKSGYQTSIQGWVIHEGDVLELGKASGPSAQFAFIYENPTKAQSDYLDGKALYSYMKPKYVGKSVVVGKLTQSGARRYLLKMCAELNVNNTEIFCADLDNAIASGEILPPPQFR